MFDRLNSVRDVADWRMCTGCGACAYGCAHGAVSLADFAEHGLRPVVDPHACTSCGRCLAYCPGNAVSAAVNGRKDASQGLGAVLEVWEGWACDPVMRRRASSGGALSALSLYCLEALGMRSVLQVGMDEHAPWRNATHLSSTREEVLARAGSRYAPASPCEGLAGIEHSDGPCVFVGKPCDAAAVSALRKLRPGLDVNLGAVLTHFCAGTPSTAGTLGLLEELAMEPGEVADLHYRGDGWPGGFRAAGKNDSRSVFLPYVEAWDRLYKHVPLRCRLCGDGFGRVADVSCGDAWQAHEDDDPGRSVILVRTERGREIVAGAREAGYLELRAISAEAVLAGQANLLRKHRQVYGRLWALRLAGIPVTRFTGFDLPELWQGLPWREKRQTVTGTLRRILSRKLWRRERLEGSPR